MSYFIRLKRISVLAKMLWAQFIKTVQLMTHVTLSKIFMGIINKRMQTLCNEYKAIDETQT